MATIALYADKINRMPGLINDIKKSVSGYQEELFSLKSKALSINKSVCDLDDVISSLQTSSQTQEDKMDRLDDFIRNNEQFQAEVEQIDREVAETIREREDQFYDKYYYLKPDCKKEWYEDVGDWFVSAYEWCKEHWVKIITVLIVIGVAVLCVVTLGMAAAVAVAAIAGIVSLVLCLADVICMIATGGMDLAALFRSKGWNVLADIFQGLSIGCDIVSIVLPAGAMIKTMAKVGLKAFAKSSMKALKLAFKETIKTLGKNGFQKGFLTGMKQLGKMAFKTFVFDIDDFTRMQGGSRVFDVFDHTPRTSIPKNIDINGGGLNPDGTLRYKPDGTTIDWPENDGFVGTPEPITLEPGALIDRYGERPGRFVSPAGIPYKNRALAPNTNSEDYLLFEVVKPIDNALGGPIASWFNQPGGGMQFKLPSLTDELLTSGIIKLRNSFYYAVKGVSPVLFRNGLESTTASVY